jgi:hypothetical protein
MLSFAKRATTIKSTPDVGFTDGIYSFHVYKDDVLDRDVRLMYFCLKSPEHISLWKLDLNREYLRKHMEETGICDIDDEVSMSIVYKAISSDGVVFHVMEKEEVSAKVIYDCGEDELEGSLNMESVARAQHPEMYAMMVGMLDICQPNPTPTPPTPTILPTEVKEKEEDNFYYQYYQQCQVVSVYMMIYII